MLPTVMFYIYKVIVAPSTLYLISGYFFPPRVTGTTALVL